MNIGMIPEIADGGLPIPGVIKKNLGISLACTNRITSPVPGGFWGQPDLRVMCPFSAEPTSKIHRNQPRVL